MENLKKDLDELVARMQTEESRKGVDQLFEMSPEELGEAAVKAANGEYPNWLRTPV